jgi:hypothetical protein
MRNFLIESVLILFVVVGVSGCDKLNKLSLPKKDIKIHKGYYVYDSDNPLIGIDYKCGEMRGVTDKRGTFLFKANSDCEFKLGSIKIRDIYSQELRDNIFLQEDNQNIIRFLKALSRNRDKIVIDNVTKKALNDLKIKEIPSSKVVFQVTIDAINSYLQKRGKKLLSSI